MHELSKYGGCTVPPYLVVRPPANSRSPVHLPLRCHGDVCIALVTATSFQYPPTVRLKKTSMNGIITRRYSVNDEGLYSFIVDYCLRFAPRTYIPCAVLDHSATTD